MTELIETADKDETLERLAAAVGDTENGQAFLRFAARCEDLAPDEFLENIDQSDYSAGDWMEALLEFDASLPESAPRNFRHLLGYLHCCQAMLKPGTSRPKLSGILRNCLQEFGYQGIIDDKK